MRNIYVAVTYAGSPNVTRTFSLYPDATGEGRLMSPLKYKASVRTWVQQERTTSTISNIILANADGELDTFVDEEFIDVQISEDVDGTTTDLAYGLIERVVLNGSKTITIKLKDATKQLDKPIQYNSFGSTEPALSLSTDRTTYALENQIKPLCWGINARSVKPVLYHRATNEYLVHDEDVFSVQTVYDRGVSVAFTQVGGGFHLTNDPDGVVVADVLGQENDTDTNRIFEIDEILDYMLDIRESISYSTSDASAINTAKGYRYSYYQDNLTNRSIREVLKWHCDSHTGWFYSDESGVLRFGYLQEPAVTQDVNISQYEVVQGIDVFDDTAPNITTKAGANRNWHIYREEEIAASVSEENRLDFINQWRDTYEAANTLDSFYTSTNEVLDTLVIGTNAQDEIDNVTSLYSQKRKFYTFDSTVIAEIGQTVNLTYPRYGLDSGVNLLCVGKEIDFINNTYRLTLWG